jgi:hypothetical protein
MSGNRSAVEHDDFDSYLSAICPVPGPMWDRLA